MKKLNELQEDSKRQFNKIRNKITEQNKYFAKEIKTKKEPNGNSETEEVNK